MGRSYGVAQAVGVASPPRPLCRDQPPPVQHVGWAQRDLPKLVPTRRRDGHNLAGLGPGSDLHCGPAPTRALPDHRLLGSVPVADPPPGTSATTATSAQLRLRSTTLARPGLSPALAAEDDRVGGGELLSDKSPAHRDVVEVPGPPSSSISPSRLMRIRLDSSHDRLLRSGLVGERVVFMGDDPAVAVPPQSDCQPEPVAGVALELLRRAAAQQCVREGHVLPRGDVE